MKLLGSNTSPYTRKVRLVLLEKGIPHAYVVDPPREPGSQVPRLNPLGRIPTLVLDDGTSVFDSPVICEYLDALNDEPILIPRADAAARMAVRRWEALADGIVDSAVVLRVESLRPADKQDPGAPASERRARRPAPAPWSALARGLRTGRLPAEVDHGRRRAPGRRARGLNVVRAAAGRPAASRRPRPARAACCETGPAPGGAPC